MSGTSHLNHFSQLNERMGGDHGKQCPSRVGVKSIRSWAGSPIEKPPTSCNRSRASELNNKQNKRK